MLQIVMSGMNIVMGMFIFLVLINCNLYLNFQVLCTFNQYVNIIQATVNHSHTLLGEFVQYFEVTYRTHFD
jgi:hypothetical protein